jgi:hypothetical protein
LKHSEQKHYKNKVWILDQENEEGSCAVAEKMELILHEKERNHFLHLRKSFSPNRRRDFNNLMQNNIYKVK